MKVPQQGPFEGRFQLKEERDSTRSRERLIILRLIVCAVISICLLFHLYYPEKTEAASESADACEKMVSGEVESEEETAESEDLLGSTQMDKGNQDEAQAASAGLLDRFPTKEERCLQVLRTIRLFPASLPYTPVEKSRHNIVASSDYLRSLKRGLPYSDPEEDSHTQGNLRSKNFYALFPIGDIARRVDYEEVLSVLDQVDLSGDSLLKYSSDSISSREKWETDSNFRLTYSNLFAQVRVSNYTVLPGLKKDVRIDRTTLTYYSSLGEVTFGDFYTTFSNGIVFASLEERPVNVDRVVEGAYSNLSYGGFNVKSFVGTFKDAGKDSADSLAGSSITFPSFWNFTPTLNLVQGRISSNLGPASGTDLQSAELSWNYRAFNFDAEMARQEYDNDTRVGNALYLKSGYTKKGFSLNTQVVDYDLISFPYIAPPSGKRFGRITDTGFERAYITTAKFRPGEGGPLYELSYSQGNSNRKTPQPYTELFGEITSDQSRDFAYRVNFDYLHDGDRFEKRPLAETLLNIGKRHSVILQGQYAEGKVFGRDYKENLFSMQYIFKPRLSLFLKHEDTTRNERLGNWDLAALQYKVSESRIINLKWGSERGGLRCSNGICAIMPPFKGLEATLQVYF